MIDTPEEITAPGRRWYEPLAAAFVWSYVNWAITIATPLVMVPLYIRFLGTQAYGQWIVILSLSSYLSLANLGLGQTLSNRIAEAVAVDRAHELRELISTAFFTYLGLSVVVPVVLLLVAPEISVRLGVDSRYSAAAAFGLYIVLNLLSFPLRVHPMLLRGLERVDREQSISAATGIVRTIALAGALIFGAKLIGIAAINGLAPIAAGVAAYIVSRKLTPAARPQWSRFSMRMLRGMAKPSLAFFGIQVGATLILGVDNLVIGYWLGSEAVTRYAVPFRLIMMAVAVFSVALGALTPTITTANARGAKTELSRWLLLSTRGGLLYATASAVGLWILGPKIIRLWAGPGVFPGPLTFGLQIATLVLLIWVSSASALLWATSRHYQWSLLTVCEGVLNLVLSLWWVRWWGMAGVVGATVVASLATESWYLPVTALRSLGVPLRTAARDLAPAVALCAVTLIVVAVSFPLSAYASAWRDVLVKFFAIEVALAVAFGAIALTREDRASALAWLGFAPRGAGAM